MKPTGIQYLVFKAFETIKIVERDIFDSETGTWYLWIFSPTTNLALLFPDGSIEVMEIEL